MERKKIKQLILIFNLITLIFAQENILIDPYDITEVTEIPKTTEIVYIEDNNEINNGCPLDLPNLKIGDYFYNDSSTDFQTFKRKNKVFILGISDSV